MYMVKDKLPNEVGTLKKSVQQLTKIVAEPAMGQSDLDVITQKVSQRMWFTLNNTYQLDKFGLASKGRVSVAGYSLKPTAC